MVAQEQKVILITGCSSGIGLTTAVYLAGRGYKVYASMRDLNKKEELISKAREAGVSVQPVQLDVTDDESVSGAVRSVFQDEGRVDVLVNNAGFGSAGFLEDFTMNEIREQFETNVYGLIRCTQAVLPLMEQQHRGHIVNISSIGGKVAFPLSPIYAATKFAVEAITESLRVQLAPAGIKVTAIEPPGVNTNFMNAVKVPQRSQNPHSPHYEQMRRYRRRMRDMAQGSALSVQPLSVAKAIYGAISSRNPGRSYPVGSATRAFLTFKGVLPNRFFERILRRQFLGSTIAR